MDVYSIGLFFKLIIKENFHSSVGSTLSSRCCEKNEPDISEFEYRTDEKTE